MIIGKVDCYAMAMMLRLQPSDTKAEDSTAGLEDLFIPNGFRHHSGIAGGLAPESADSTLRSLKPDLLPAVVRECNTNKRLFAPYDSSLARHFVKIYFKNVRCMNMGGKEQTSTC